MKKKLTSLLFCLALTLGLMLAVAGAAMAADKGAGTESSYTEITSWQDLQDTITANETAYLKLTADCTCPNPTENSARPITIPAGKTVFLDLNGQTLDRGLTNAEAVENGNVITVKGNLTLLDNSTDKTGTVTGGAKTGSANGGGAGVSIQSGTFTLENGKISGNKFTGNGGNGGGVYLTNGTFSMKGGTIGGTSSDDANTARDGGGVFIDNKASFNMTGGTISGNTATNRGGGVYVNSGTFTMKNATINNNTATNQGGGVFLTAWSDEVFTMENGIITENNALSNGGGIYISASVFNMKNSTISNNTITGMNGGNGGGVFFGSGTFTMDGGTISGNTITGQGQGGGVYNGNDGTFTMKNGTIEGNTGQFGGGVSNSGTFTMDRGTISGNTATYQGGGVNSQKTFTMKGGTISGNTVNKGRFGGGVACKGTFTLQGSSFSITGNKNGSANENVLLITTGEIGTIGGNFDTAKPIGVTLINNGMSDLITGNITTDASYGSDADARKAFVSENPKYIVYNNEGQAALKDPTAKDVEDMINELPQGDKIKPTDQTAIDAAKATYDNLSQAEKDNVPEEAKNKLNKAVEQVQQAVQDLNSAKESAKGELDTLKTEKEQHQDEYESDDWTKLTNAIDGGKTDIDNAETEEAVTAAKDAATQAVNAIKTKEQKNAEVNAVKGKIDALDGVTSETAESKKGDIEAARAAYNALDEGQKQQIDADTLKKLTDAELALAKANAKADLDKLQSQKGTEESHEPYTIEEWAEIKKAISDGKSAIEGASDTNGVNTEKQKAVKAVEDIDKVKAVKDKITALGEVTAENALDMKSAIEEARAAYNALGTEDLKNKVTNYDTLQAAEATLLSAAKAAAKAELDTLQSRKTQSDYSSDDWTTLTTAISTGKTNIDNAETDTIAEVDAAKNAAISAVNNVKTEAQKVEALIEPLPEASEITTDVTSATESAINEAKNKFDALGTTKQGQVSETNQQKLADVVQALADANAAKTVAAQIAALPGKDEVTVANIAEKETAITEAKEAYDALDAGPKAKVPEATKTKLDEAVKALADAKAAKTVNDTINGLPGKDDVKVATIATYENAINQAENDFNNLTADQKAKVPEATQTKLNEAVQALKDAKTAQPVSEQINALNNPVTSEDTAAVKAAREAFDKLNSDQQGKIDSDTLKKLTDAEAALKDAAKTAALEELDKLFEGKGAPDYSDQDLTDLQTAKNTATTAINSANTLNAIDDAVNTAKQTIDDIDAAKEVKDKINALPDNVTSDASDKVKAAIKDARAAYDELTDEQKTRVDQTTLNKLTSAENALLQGEKDAANKALEDLLKSKK
ncbi:MAG: hypothetical protein IJH61_07715 [Eubacteriaceae bacterium]|nr:hypothetical protein [Eubacteriaceae bacterium]